MPDAAETTRRALSRMRAISSDPNIKAEMQASWDRVCAALEPEYLAARPKLLSYEVHHMNAKGRERFAHAIAADHPFDECADLAIEWVKLALKRR